MLGDLFLKKNRSLSDDGHSRLPKLTFILIAICWANSAFGFMNNDDGHRGITNEALGSISVDLADTKRGFSPKALDEIQSSIAGVDLPIWGEFSDAVAHCDDETLPACFQRVVDKKKQVLDLLKGARPDGKQARRILGQALHTVQDFYSHSNWVHEPGPNKNDINRELGVAWPNKKLGGDRATCIEGGVFEGNHILVGDGLTEITTGYFRKSGIPANKCNHGGPLYGGINKDAADTQFFKKARGLAVTATRVFVKQIFQELKKNEKAVHVLLEGE